MSDSFDHHGNQGFGGDHPPPPPPPGPDHHGYHHHHEGGGCHSMNDDLDDMACQVRNTMAETMAINRDFVVSMLNVKIAYLQAMQRVFQRGVSPMGLVGSLLNTVAADMARDRRSRF